MCHFSFQWRSGEYRVIIRVALRAADLDSVLEAGGGLLTSLPPQRPFFRLSILFSCSMDARFSHTTASFYTN